MSSITDMNMSGFHMSGKQLQYGLCRAVTVGTTVLWFCVLSDWLYTNMSLIPYRNCNSVSYDSTHKKTTLCTTYNNSQTTIYTYSFDSLLGFTSYHANGC